MADDKNGRENQAQNVDRRQRERDMREALDRGDEPEPPIEEEELDAIEEGLESVSFPATGADVVDAVGDREIDAGEETYAMAELVPDTDEVTFEEPTEVRMRAQRPTVAIAMTQIDEAVDGLRNAEVSGSQRSGYERTFRELRAFDALDYDEGIQVVADWIVEQIEEKGTIPGSRGVRRRGGKYVRSQGHDVRNDEWLGI